MIPKERVIEDLREAATDLAYLAGDTDLVEISESAGNLTRHASRLAERLEGKQVDFTRSELELAADLLRQTIRLQDQHGAFLELLERCMAASGAEQATPELCDAAYVEWKRQRSLLFKGGFGHG